jgi:hypothetical protein
VYNDPDTSLQPKWNDTYSAEVVADDTVVVVDGVEYECFEVDGRSIAPLKIVNTISYIGTETMVMVDADPPPGSW